MTAPTPTPAARYRKRPVTIEAVQLAQRFPWPDWFHDAVTANKIITHGLGKFADGPVWCEIETLEGVMRASEGDWIIRGVAGEIYPCKPEIFSATYEPAGTPTPDAETREAMIERAMETVKREYARFLFGNDDRTFENSFTADFQEQFAEDQGRLFAAGLDAILSSGLVVPAAEVEETKRLLSDPNAVHINMLAGKIAKPSVEQIVHTYAGEVVPAHTVSDLAVMHMERDQAIADLAERDAQIARLREALQLMVDHDADYMAINHLGDPEVQQRICVARAALGETAP